MALSQYVHERAQYWASADVFDKNTRNEIAKLIEKKDYTELNDRFHTELEFGTAGLRGLLGAGDSRMNFYNVRRASFAIAQYTLENSSENKSVAISYDCRRYSKEFAQTTAEVLAAYKIKSYLTDRLQPVPVLAHMVREYKCSAGVYITASHNPPNYNGYKVYLRTGGQVIPPHDQQIMDHYTRARRFEAIQFLTYEQSVQEGWTEIVNEEIASKYLNSILGLRNTQTKNNIKIVYTPLHGTGGELVPKTLAAFGFQQVCTVPDQKEPDANFPTVTSPNPGEPNSFKTAIAFAKSEKADVVLATDPDCDRLAMAIPRNGEYSHIEGNQMICLLTHYLLSQRSPSSTPPLVIKTVVTTNLMKIIAKSFDAKVEETLTGFKWIGDRIEAYERGKTTPYKEYVCGGEEAYGFLAGNKGRDKDGISASAIAAEMVAFHHSEGRNLWDVLNTLYQRHGYFLDSLHTESWPGQSGAEAREKTMEALRQTSPTEVAGERVVLIRDFLTGEETHLDETSPSKQSLDFPRSNVLQFFLEGGSQISARPSGTEPLIKYYFSIRESLSQSAPSLEEAVSLAKNKASVRTKAFLDWLKQSTQTT